MEVSVSGLEYDSEHIFRFTPKPGDSKFVAWALRKHLSKMLAVIVDHVDKSSNDELRMYKFITSTFADDSPPSRQRNLEPDADPKVGARLGIMPQKTRDAPSMQKPAGNSCSSCHPISVPRTLTWPATGSGELEQADPLPPLQSASYTSPPDHHHHHRSEQVEQKTLSNSDEDEFPVAPPQVLQQLPPRPLAMAENENRPRSPTSPTSARRSSYVRPGRVVAMDLSEFVFRHSETIHDPEDVQITMAVSADGRGKRAAGLPGGPIGESGASNGQQAD